MRRFTIFRNTSILAVIAAAALLATAAPADAVYIETPLVIEAPDDHAEVDDTIEFTIGPNPNNASAQEQWAGKTVNVRYSYDKNEGQDGHHGDEPVSNQGYTEGTILDGLTLDEKARGTFTWTIPSEVDDRNVNIFLEEDGHDERLAFAYLAVGNATPMMHAMSGPSDGEPEIGPEDKESHDDAVSDTNEAAGIAAAGLLGTLALAGVAVALVRRRQ